MDSSLPLNAPDPRELPAPEGECFRRSVRVHALLETAEDVDSERRSEIAREILILGAGTLPALSQAAAGPRENTAALARSLVRLLVPDQIGAELLAGIVREKSDYAVENGAITLARLAYPNLVIKNVLRDLDELGQRAGVYICDHLSIPFNQMRHAAHAQTVDVVKKLGEFWREEGFNGLTENYYNELNSYIPDILERRTGLPITLSVVYLAIARRVYLHAEGVGMPGHFIVRVRVNAPDGEEYILLDPFNGARTLNVEECRQRVESTGQPFVPDDHLKASPPRDILTRMCNNLLGLFDNQRKTLDAERVATVLVHLQPADPVPRLLRAERRLRRGERKGARADFLHAQKLDPGGPIGRAAEELLRRMDFEDPFK